MKAKKLIKHLGDALGSVRQLADVGGAVSLARGYDPFGNASWNAGSAQTPYGFTAEQTDANGLVYLRARYYAPYLNQFIQPDTIVPDPRTPADWNKYAYTRNNPINFTDPTGKSPVPDQDYQACISSYKLNDVNSSVKENVCKMISELEVKGYLINTIDADHIEEGYRTEKDAHRLSTAFHILHDFVSIEDLRKTPKDSDGTEWYKKEWDIYYCALEQTYIDSQTKIGFVGYLDYLVKKNASSKVDKDNYIDSKNPIKSYVFTLYGAVPNINYAMEGYRVGDPRRLPNSSLPKISTHTYGVAVDISNFIYDGIRLTGYTEVDAIARKYNLKRPYNKDDYVPYTTAELREWWHFESLFTGR